MRKYLPGKTDLKKISFFVFLIVVISCLTISKNSNANSNESVISAGHSHQEINRGKRVFMGLLPFDRKYESCVSCHLLKQVDTLNWNPSATDIALKYAEKDFVSFQTAVMQPSGVKMTASHKNFDIKEEDLKSVKAYLDDLANTGTKTVKPSYYYLILFSFVP